MKATTESSRYAVAIVVDPGFGEALIELSKRIPVWVCGSPTNKCAAEIVWQQRPNNRKTGVTTFRYDEGDAPDRVVLGILDVVDLHHGEYSHSPPWTDLEVYGAALTATLESALRELGFIRFLPTDAGFRCSRA